MATTVNKVDMSLDEIIKMDRKKTQKTSGKDPKLLGRGFRKSGFQQGARGRGQGGRGRGQRGSGQGQRGRRLQRISSGISPLNRTQMAQQGMNTSTQGSLTLAEKRKKAFEALKKAKQRFALLTQQQDRQAVVNQRRGIQTTANQRINNRGRRGNGRGFLTRSYGSQQRLNQYQNDRQLSNRGGRGRGRGRGMGRGRSQGGLLYDSQVPDFNLTNQTRGQLPAAEGQTKIGRQQKRKLYRSFDSGLSSNNGIFTISVNNPTPRKETKRSKLQRQIQSLKPTVSTNYKFKPEYFANAGTSVSLNERFAGNGGERKIFL